MSLTVLTDEDVRRVLHSLTKEDVLDIQQSLADGLHQYSTAGEEDGCCSSYQPQRTSMKWRDNRTTLFMPASSNNGLGVKIITLQTPDESASPPIDLKRLSVGSTKSSSSTGTSRETSRETSISSASKRASTELLFPPPHMKNLPPQDASPRGSLTLFDAEGAPSALINAEELTAFRTALASCMLLKKRKSVHDVTIFGAGKQAYWHLRLCLLLRGSEVHHINVINRSFERARSMLYSLYNPFPEDPDYVNLIGQKYNSKTRTSILTPTHSEYTRLLKENVRAANVIFCTTPSTQPLFPAGYLLNPEGRKKGRYIACIGSYKPYMIELHPDILRSAVAPHHQHRHYHKHQKEGGAVIVDSVEACMQESGEIIQAKLEPEQVVELGELIMLRMDAAKAARRKQTGGEDDAEGVQVEDSLKEWLYKGNVVYKSVGLGLMDVVVGNEVVRLAKERGIGTHIPNF